MKILITGGAGFIGLHTAHALATTHDLIAIDNLLPQVHVDPAASRARFPGEVLVADVCDPGAWQRVGSCDLVVHLAAETGTAQSMYERERYFRVNVSGTGIAARFASQWDAPMVSLSSRAVYGEGRYECEIHGSRHGGRCCIEAIQRRRTRTMSIGQCRSTVRRSRSARERFRPMPRRCLRP